MSKFIKMWSIIGNDFYKITKLFVSKFDNFSGTDGKRNIMTENMAKIQLAFENGGTVKNQKGERIGLPKSVHNRTDDCIRCYVGIDAYYWSTAAIQEEIFVNGQPFEEWLNLQPLEILKNKKR